MNAIQRSISTAQLASLCHAGAMVNAHLANAYRTLAVYLVRGLISYENGKALFVAIRSNR